MPKLLMIIFCVFAAALASASTEVKSDDAGAEQLLSLLGDDTTPAVVTQAEELKDDLTAATYPNGDPGSACADDFAGLQSLLAETDREKTAGCQEVKDQGFCNQPEFELRARQYCKKTCGFCDGALVPFVGRLCPAGNTCCYISKVQTTVSQTTKPTEAKTTLETYQFCVSAFEDGKHVARFTLEDTSGTEMHVAMNEDGTFDTDDEAAATARTSKALEGNDLYFEIDRADGSLKSVKCAPGAENLLCLAQNFVVTQALKKVQVAPAAKTAALLEDGKLHITEAGHHPKFGKYTRHHHATRLAGGRLELLSHTVYTKARGSDDEVLSSTTAGEAEEEVMGIVHTEKEKRVVDSNGHIGGIEDIETTLIGVADMPRRAPKPDFATSFFELKDPAHPATSEETELGRAPDEMAPVGQTLFEVKFQLGLETVTKGVEGTGEAPAEYLQVTNPHIDVTRKEKKKLDFDAIHGWLTNPEESMGTFVFLLDDHPEYIKRVDNMVVSWLQSDLISEIGFAKYLSALAAVNHTRAESTLFAHLEDGAMQTDHEHALLSAIASMPVRDRDEATVLRLLHLVKAATNSAVRDQALLIIGGLLKPHAHKDGTDAMPAWAHGIFESIVEYLDSNDGVDGSSDVDLPVAISAVGNTRWKRAEAHLAKYIMHADDFVVHNAIDGLRRLPDKLAANTTTKLRKLLSHPTRWANTTSLVPQKALRLIQFGSTESSCKYNECIQDQKFVGIQAVKLFQRRDGISSSDIHAANTLVQVSLQRDPKDSSIKFSASAALEGNLYSFQFTHEKKNAALEAGFEAAYTKNDHGLMEWSKGIFIDIMGIRVKTWGKDAAKQEEKKWKDRLIAAGKLVAPLALNLAGQAWANKDDLWATPKPAKPDDWAICQGKFDFKKAANGVNGNSTHGGMAMDVSYQQTLFNHKQKFCWWIFCVGVRFIVTGGVGVMPAVAWGSGAENGCQGSATTWVGGLRPYALLSVTIEVSLDFGIVSAGVGGKINIVTLGFPMYGRHVSGGWATETNCGSMEFEVDAFAGNLYLFFEYWTPFSWKRKSIGILDWNGLYRGWQLFPANESPTFPACSVCQWRSSCLHRHHMHHNHHRHHVHHAHHNHHVHHRHHRHFWGRRRLLDAKAEAKTLPQ